jgi:hypothetical protein
VLVVNAFHQPITRPEIEAVRGVSPSQATMELLLETGLITARGRKQAPGTPALWVTTPLFLAQFGLKSLRDPPGSDVMMAISPAWKHGAPSRPARERRRLMVRPLTDPRQTWRLIDAGASSKRVESGF